MELDFLGMVLLSLIFYLQMMLSFIVKLTLKWLKVINSILSCYKESSDQSINFSKSNIFLNPNIFVDVRHNIACILQIHHLEIQNFQLFPKIFHELKDQFSYYFKNHVANKTAGQNEQILFKGGKEVLIRSVLLFIPLYAMFCFRLPSSVCKDLNFLILSF